MSTVVQPLYGFNGPDGPGGFEGAEGFDGAGAAKGSAGFGGVGGFPGPGGPAARAEARFEREVLAHLDRLYTGALRLTPHPAEAEDLVQRTFERAFQDFHWARPQDTIRAWLFHHLVGVWFDDEPHLPVAPLPAAPEPGSADAAMRGAIASLTPVVRLTLHLSDVEGFSEQQIAEITEVPPGIVAARLRRAHERLADHLVTWLRANPPTARTVAEPSTSQGPAAS